MKRIFIMALFINLISTTILAQSFTLYKNQVDNSLQALAIDENKGRIWVGTNETINGNTFAFLEGENWTVINATEKGLINGRATDIEIYGDHVALSSFGGVSIVNWDSNSFTTYTSSNSDLRVDPVNAFTYNSKSKKLYAAVSNGFGVQTLDNGTWNEGIDEAKFIKHLVYDEQNDLVYAGGLGVDIVKIEGSTTTNIGVNVYCTGLALAPNNDLWIAAENGEGIYKYDGSNLINYNSSNSPVPEGKINNIAVTTDGYVWFTASNRLYKFDGTDIISFGQFDSDLPSVNVRQMKADKNGNLWLASASGLVKVSPNATSIKELNTSINIFPNPCSHYLTIDPLAQINFVKIIDMNGKTVLHTNETKIDISSLQNGIYTVEITTSTHKNTSQKIIKI